MSKNYQLHWRVRPDGPWQFHSRVEEQQGIAQMQMYHDRHPASLRSFDYRVIAEGSDEALQPIAPSIFVGRMESAPASFQFGSKV